jgi:hypothetical protein
MPLALNPPRGFIWQLQGCCSAHQCMLSSRKNAGSSYQLRPHYDSLQPTYLVVVSGTSATTLHHDQLRSATTLYYGQRSWSY